MAARVTRFFRRHPILRDVLLWSLPALLLGAILRVLLLSYLPLGYWGSDSKSYYGLAHRLFTEGQLVNEEKRRYLYPLLMVPVTALPGAPLRWLAWLQHGMGLLCVLPMAYVARRTLHWWKAWIIPITLLYVMHPLFLWYEHELLGECVFFAGLVWAFGGWVAWVSERDPVRARRLFWWFYVPLAVFLLTKPAGRFVLPGLALGLLAVRAWRVLNWVRWAALALLAAVTFKVGSSKQGAWLLYTASFPLTQLETPLYAEYKKDIRERVLTQAARIDLHYSDSRAAMDFLEEPSKQGGTPLWADLDKRENEELRRKVYMSLALEGIKARPGTYAYLALQRLAASANISAFDDVLPFPGGRFSSRYYPWRFEKLYEDARRVLAEKGPKATSLPMAFGLKHGEALPAYAEFRPRLATAETWAEQAVVAVTSRYGDAADFVALPPSGKNVTDEQRSFKNTRLTWLGWWLIASLALSLVRWRTLGVWAVTSVGYLCGVYLCALVQTRFFLPAWFVFIPAVFVPLDLLVQIFPKRSSSAVPSL